jgi:hypothetical protein
MARFHLPTVTPEEMKFRMLSLHVAAQYFVLLKGKKPDWKLAGLKKYFHDFSAVLRSLRSMVQPAVRKDAVPNALTRLDCLAVNVALLNHRGLLEDMAAAFTAYLKPPR